MSIYIHSTIFMAVSIHLWSNIHPFNHLHGCLNPFVKQYTSIQPSSWPSQSIKRKSNTKLVIWIKCILNPLQLNVCFSCTFVWLFFTEMSIFVIFSIFCRRRLSLNMLPEMHLPRNMSLKWTQRFVFFAFHPC